jgi:hypothetical protein
MHVTTPVVIEGVEVAVDVGIVAVIEWLNSFESVVTLFSCEGDEKRSAYVLFRCGSSEELKTILLRLDGVLSPHDLIRYGTVIVDWFDGEFRYELKFENVKMRECFVASLKNGCVTVPDGFKRHPAIAARFPL